MSRLFRGSILLATAAFFPVLAMADDARSTGIITSISRSATISTEGMPPGSEMWAMWLSLPAGKKVEMKEAKIPSIWMDLEVVLTGSTASGTTSGRAPEEGCVLFDDAGQRDASGQEVTNTPGDAFACNFGAGVPFWEENRGSELYTRAQLSIGGPWAPGMSDTPEEARMVGGEARAANVNATEFGDAEKELRGAGMMTATTRVVTMPPGSKSMAVDRYPTLRMVTSGELKWGTTPAGSDPSVTPKRVFREGRFMWVVWNGPRKIVLSNESDKPVEFVEWTVAPASGNSP